MFLALSLLLAAIGLVLLYDFVRKSGKRWRQLQQFPGDYPLPLIGNALQLGFDADESAHKIMNVWTRHGKTNFRMTIGSEEWVLLCEPKDIGMLLSHPTELAKSPERNAALMPFFGNSVSSSEGERWRWTRKLMTPSFHFKTLEQRVNAVNIHCERLIDILSEYENNGAVDLYRYLRPYMFDILCNSLMGVESNLIEDPDNPYLVASGKVINIATQNFFSYWRNIRILFQMTSIYQEMMDVIKTIREKSNAIIAQRRIKLNKIMDETRKNNKNSNIDLKKLIEHQLAERSCLLDSLILTELPNGDQATDEMINEELTLLCFTGHYTTTMTISHTLYCLAKYPEIQKLVIDEQRSIFSNDTLRKPTNQDLNDMKYLEAVIKESMRVIPTVPKISRTIEADMLLKDGRVIPAGTTVIIHNEALCRNEKVFQEPHKYSPERFFNNFDSFAFIPFSAGPRNCIGFRYAWVALKATLSNILRRFEVCPGGPGTEPRFAYRIITESVNGLQLKLKKRAF